MFIKKIKTCKRQVSKQKKRKQTRKVNRKISHNGGNQQLTDQNIFSQIITSVNGTPELITAINNALQNYTQQKPSTDSAVKALQQKYSTGISGNKLYDLIYANQKLTQYDSTKSPSLIWNHGVNNPKSITAGKLGTHIYVYKDANTSLFKLLGVIIR